MSRTLLTCRPDDCTSTVDGYEEFFEELLRITARTDFGDRLGEELKELAREWIVRNSMDRFNEYSDKTYRRTYLGRDHESGWEAILMTWKHGNRTSIHAHPQFAGYNFADGIFRVEIFEPAGDGRARLVEECTVTAPESFFAIGAAGRFDNHIHRITCLSETGHSLHIYSDDALRGQIYEELTGPNR